MEGATSQSKKLPIVLAALFAIATTHFYLINKRIFTYITLPLFLGSLIFVLSQKQHPLFGNLFDNFHITSMPDWRAFDSTIFILIAYWSIANHLTPIGLNVSYYWWIAAISILILLRIQYAPYKTIALLQIFLLGLLTRESIYFSAPVIGMDVRLHIALSTYIENFGEVIPESMSYYHWYPLPHINSGILSLIADIPGKNSVFLTIALTGCAGIIIIYKLSEKFFKPYLNRQALIQAGLFGALLFSISPWQIHMMGLPIAQSFSLALVPFALYLFYSKSQKFLLLFLLISTVLTLSHNLTPLVLTAILSIFYMFDKASSLFQNNSSKISHPSAVALIPILAIQHWVLSQIFGLQVSRLLRPLSPGSSLSSAVSSSNLVMEHAFTLTDPLLHTGIEQITYLALFTILFWALIFKKRLNQQPISIILSSFVIYSAISFALLEGESSHTWRTLGNISIVVAPIVGYLAQMDDLKGKVGILALISLILLLPVSTGIAVSLKGGNPAASLTERGYGARMYLTHSELNGVNKASSFASDGQKILTDRYTAESFEFLELSKKGAPNSIIQRFNNLKYVDSNQIHNQLNTGNYSIFIYHAHYGLGEKINSFSAAFDNGGSKLIAN